MNSNNTTSIEELENILDDAQETHWSKWGTKEDGRKRILIDELMDIIKKVYSQGVTDTIKRVEEGVNNRITKLESDRPTLETVFLQAMLIEAGVKSSEAVVISKKIVGIIVSELVEISTKLSSMKEKGMK